MVFVYICPAPVPTQHGVGGISVALIKFCSLMLLVWFCGFQTWGEMENLICSTFVVAYQYKPRLQCRKQNKKMYIKPQPQTQSSRHCKLHRAASACLMEEEVYCCRHPETTCTAAGLETLLHLNQYGFWQQFLSVFSQT